MNLEVHPEVTGVAEGLAAVFTLVRLHPHVAHEVHVELGAGDEGPGTHAALELLLPRVTLTLRSAAVRVCVAAAAATVVVAVCLSRSMSVAGPRGGGGARGPVGELVLRVRVLVLLRRLLLLLLLRGVVLRWAVAVGGLVMLVTVMAVQVRLELREGGTLFAALADLTLGHLRNTCRDIHQSVQLYLYRTSYTNTLRTKVMHH